MHQAQPRLDYVLLFLVAFFFATLLSNRGAETKKYLNISQLFQTLLKRVLCLFPSLDQRHKSNHRPTIRLIEKDYKQPASQPSVRGRSARHSQVSVISFIRRDDPVFAAKFARLVCSARAHPLLGARSEVDAREEADCIFRRGRVSGAF